MGCVNAYSDEFVEAAPAVYGGDKRRVRVRQGTRPRC